MTYTYIIWTKYNRQITLESSQTLIFYLGALYPDSVFLPWSTPSSCITREYRLLSVKSEAGKFPPSALVLRYGTCGRESASN